MINFYVPSEYEEMLLAAGWVTLADLDDQYIEYRKRAEYISFHCVKNEFLMDYSTWKSEIALMEHLNQRYQNEVDPFYRADNDAPIPEHIQALHKEIVDQISEIETILGY